MSSSSSWLVDVPPGQFERQVIERSRQLPVVVDFWAPWCGPCVMLGPLLERLVAERQGQVVLAKVNVDESPDLAARYGASSIPLVIAFRGGQPVLDFVGLLPEAQIRRFLDDISPGPAEQLAEQARGLEGSDPARAEALYRQALAADQRSELAAVGLARVLIGRGEHDEAGKLLEEVGALGELAAEVERLQGLAGLAQLAQGLPDEGTLRQRLAAAPADARLLYELGCTLAKAGRHDEALQRLLAAAERDPALASGKVREAMVQIFQVLGPQSTLANDYRNRLTTLLY